MPLPDWQCLSPWHPYSFIVPYSFDGYNLHKGDTCSENITKVFFGADEDDLLPHRSVSFSCVKDARFWGTTLMNRSGITALW